MCTIGMKLNVTITNTSILAEFVPTKPNRLSDRRYLSAVYYYMKEQQIDHIRFCLNKYNKRLCVTIEKLTQRNMKIP